MRVLRSGSQHIHRIHVVFQVERGPYFHAFAESAHARAEGFFVLDFKDDLVAPVVLHAFQQAGGGAEARSGVAQSLLESPGYAEDQERKDAVQRACEFVCAAIREPLMSPDPAVYKGGYDVRGWGHCYRCV